MDLFNVVNVNTKNIVKSGFSKKADAKSYRDELNNEDNKNRYHVTRSKGHWKGAVSISHLIASTRPPSPARKGARSGSKKAKSVPTLNDLK